MKRSLLSFFVLAFSLSAAAESPAPGGRGTFTRDGNVLTFAAPEGDVRLEFCTPALFRVRKSRNGVFAENERWMVVKYDWSPVNIRLEEREDRYVLTTDSLNITACSPRTKDGWS